MSYAEQLQESLERDEARMYLRFAAQALTAKELMAIEAMLEDIPPIEIERAMGLKRGVISKRQARGLLAMRARLNELGFTATHQLLST